MKDVIIEKYNLNINDIIENKIDLSKRNIDDKEIENLVNMGFKGIKELNLYKNNISDIKALERVDFEKIEKLNLCSNKISNIKILENVNFRELKELYLNSNNIIDIKA